MAFVEGYESGLQRQMRGRTMLFKIVLNMIAVSVFLVILIIWLYRMYKNRHYFYLKFLSILITYLICS